MRLRIEIVVIVVIGAMCMMHVRGVKSRISPCLIDVQMESAGLHGHQADERNYAKYFRWAVHLWII